MKMKFSSGSMCTVVGVIPSSTAVKIATPLLLLSELAKTSYFLPLASLKEFFSLCIPLIPSLLTSLVSERNIMSVAKLLTAATFRS